jgi:hypothetical protein
MLRASLTEVGTARSIVIDEHNVVLAGNGILDAAKAIGIEHVHIVESDGKSLVAVRRSGLSDDEKRSLAMYDNRTAELAEWVPEQLAEDRAHNKSLSTFFTRMETSKLLREPDAKSVEVAELETSRVNDRFWISIRGPLLHQAVSLQRLQTLLADLDVEVELGILAEEVW